jgi:alkylmercury lyase-like protein
MEAVDDNHSDSDVTLPEIPLRQAALPAAIRELHRTVLRAFLDAGRPPSKRELHGPAEALGLDVDVAFQTLAEVDLVHISRDGTVVVAYPFSGRDTGILIQRRGGLDVQAMCAVDALGIPPMSDEDAVVAAVDPHNRRPIRIETCDRQWSWQPESTVVLLGKRSLARGPSATCVCPVITFHTNVQSASDHLAALSGVQGRVLLQDEALELAEKLFGGLLSGHPTPRPTR